MTDRDAFNDDLLRFLASAPTPFHAAAEIEARLRKAGFVPFHASAAPQPAGPGVFLRQGGSVIALKPGQAPLEEEGLRMVGAHTDSPCLMVKPRPEQTSAGYRQLGVEVYGGALLNPWFDRDLSLAGRVSFAAPGGGVATALVDFECPIAVIPSLAIHLDREANKNRSVNAQTQMAPLLALASLGDSDGDWDLRQALTERLRAAGETLDEVLDYELCFYDTQPPAIIGLRGEFIASARLDNLLSCYTGMAALLAGGGARPWSLLVCNDHEEVGSLSASGAQGPMLRHFLQSLSPTPLPVLMQSSMMISADNAHGVHPNFKDRHDPSHGPMLNGGPVIKVNASQRYASSSDGAALFRLLASRLDLPVQSFAMRADMACGSTIGPLTAGEIGVTTLDVGVPTFAMHSIRELAGSDDAWTLCRILRTYFAEPAPLFAAGAGSQDPHS
ncbi:MAG: M18 family aminopeptidase [Pseudomonadota bacterium]